MMWKLAHFYALILYLQLHIAFCVYAAIAPPIVFKGKSITLVFLTVQSTGFTNDYCYISSFVYEGGISTNEYPTW